MTAPGRDGPAKVERHEGMGAWVVVGPDGAPIAWADHGKLWELWDAEARRDNINSSFATIVARAALVDRMADLLLRHLRVHGRMRALGQDVDAGFEKEAESLTAEYDALLSTTEGRKDKNEMP